MPAMDTPDATFLILLSKRNKRPRNSKAGFRRITGAQMDLDVRQSGNICTLKLKGPFKSVESARDFDRAVEAALSNGHIYLILDLEAMPVIDSLGIGTIVNALRRSRQFGGDAKLVNPSPFAMKTFKMVRILDLFDSFTSETDAIEACSKA
jgi:anti-anti-sigma factor